MSEILSAAAEAMGLPEALVQRSAEARAAETGDSADEILAAWAGGEVPASTSTAPSEVEEEAPAQSEPDTPSEPEPASPPPAVVMPPSQTAESATPAPAGPYKPPVLVGVSDNPVWMLVGVLGVFIMVVLVAVVGPSLPDDEAGARTSEIAFSAAAEDGQELYENLGCVSCHTQMVRPVVADVGLGAVTLNDTNQVLGTRRFGPDLADVGSRMTAEEIGTVVLGAGDHPAHSLSEGHLAALTAYLAESKGSG